MSRQLNNAKVEFTQKPALISTKSAQKPKISSSFQPSKQKLGHKFGSTFVSKQTSFFDNEVEKNYYKKACERSNEKSNQEAVRVITDEEDNKTSTYLNTSEGLVDHFDGPKSQISESSVNLKLMSVGEQTCRKQLVQHHLSVLEAMELLDLNVEQEIVKQAMDQLFQQNIVQPPNKIEVWPVLPDSSHSAKSETNAPAISRVKRNLTISIVQFLRQEASDSQHSAERIEAIEAAVQFLELAFNLSDKDYAFQPSKPLLELFEDVEGSSDKDDEELSKPTAADIEKADRLKEEGNELVKESKFQEAVQKYNEAIKLNRDPIYFCNRAAAYCRLERNDLAILDCRTALALDPNYAKAYGRMGVALSCQERYEDAVEAYKKAVELDPNNESYKTNLSIAKIKLRQTQQATNAERTTPGFPGFGGFGELGGMGGLLNNPQVAQMAAQAMSDPNVQQMMSQMMGSFLGPNAAQNQEGGQNPGANPAANLGGLENLMRVGEQIAEAMSAQNPELVEQLRRFNRGPDNANGSEDGSTDERP